MEKKVNLHEGHRKRMWKKYLEYGLNAFNEHEILEMLLYMFIPRMNTNPTAHTLIDRFGSLKDVLNAPRGELLKIEHIGENTAMQIAFINDLTRYINTCASKSAVFSNSDIIIKYCKDYFRGKDKECLAIFLVDKNMCVVNSLEYKLERQGSDIDCTDLVYRLSQYKCHSIVLAHNHPDGGAYSSNNDVLFTRSVYTIMKAIHIKILDHIVIKGDSGYSIRNSGEVSDIWL